MRKLWPLGLLTIGMLFAAPVTLDDDNRVTIANCGAGGSSASALVAGSTYVLAIFDEETWVCFAASSSTCAAGGIRLAPGAMLRVSITSDHASVSCRSAGATGDAEFTPGG
jgi:hypothetical protein